MSSRGSQSSQVGLFSTQISEQILRLRALERGDRGSAEENAVELKRAVMATRLLAGSARILHLDALQEFLDELLAWLQKLEQKGKALGSTQALILESVLELEEALMLHLDERAESEADLSPFDEQLTELHTLIHRNLEFLEGRGETEAESPGAEEADAPAEEAGAAETAGEEIVLKDLVDSLDAAVRQAEDVVKTTQPGTLPPVVLRQLETLTQRLIRALDLSDMVPVDEEPMPAVDEEAEGATALGDALAHPEDDPIVGPLCERLQQVAHETGMPLEFRAYGSSDLLDPAMHDLLKEILGHLFEDVCIGLRVLASDSEVRSANTHVSLQLRNDHGRLHVVIRDDFPRSDRSGVFGDTDHLALFGGLRRARGLIEEINGLIRVEPEEEPDQRFALTLPRDPQRLTYSVLQLDGALVAVPWALVEGVISTAGLMYEADPSGESFVRHGRNVALVDLAQFVGEVVPAAEPTRHIAIVGSVEKRLGIGCGPEMRLVESSELSDPPGGWENVAYATVEVDGEPVPVLDVKDLVRLRFSGADAFDLSGAIADPVVDSYVPVDEETGPPPTAAEEEETVSPLEASIAGDEEGGLPPEDGTARLAILVNQSEFRRRELSRALQALGYTVNTVKNLSEAARQLETEPMQLLVTDLRLGQEGGESFQTIRRQHEELTIVLTSSVAQEFADELAEKTGAHACWLDPFRQSDLEKLLAQLRTGDPR